MVDAAIQGRSPPVIFPPSLPRLVRVTPAPGLRRRQRCATGSINLTYRWFIVPGLSGILAFFSALLITSLSIARERELGTFDQLLVSPTSTPEIIVSKSLPALVIGTMLGLLMMAAAAGPFQIPFNGSFGLLFVSLVLFILSVVGIGLMISAISATQQQAILGAFAIGVPAVLMSGFATPVENTRPQCCNGWLRRYHSPISSSSWKAAF